MGVTCDQHRSVLHRQQFRPSAGDPDQDGAVDQQEKPVDNRRNDPIQGGHECGGADLRRAAPFELPRQSGDEDQRGGQAEPSTCVHVQTAMIHLLVQSDNTRCCLSGPLPLRHAPKPVPQLWLRLVEAWASPIVLIPYQKSKTFQTFLSVLLVSHLHICAIQGRSA